MDTALHPQKTSAGGATSTGRSESRTLHVARAIMTYAVDPFPDSARAISAAFAAYIRGALQLNLTGHPSSWAVVHGPEPNPAI